MKTRLVIIAILLFILTILLSRNDTRIVEVLLRTINPIKQSYKTFTQNLKDKSRSYIFQKESIEKLSHENRVLHKRLLEQMHYIEQIKNIYDTLPQLRRLPIHAVSIVQTISYVKLNSFSQIILTKPKDIVKKKFYGLIQGRVVAGIAHIQNNQLYGYLTSDEKCRFSVFTGETKAPGIAFGHTKNEMIIKFIPKWHHIKRGDKVVTSGLDNIFFANIPVGIVTKVEIQSAYTVAHIKTYSDIFHPQTFFMIHDTQTHISQNFDRNQTKAVSSIQQNILNMHQQNESNISLETSNNSSRHTAVSSIPSRIDQTQNDIVQPETVEEIPNPPKVKVHKRRKKKKKHTNTFDLF